MSDVDSIVSDDISVASEGSEYDYDERSQASYASRTSKASRSSSGRRKKSPKGGGNNSYLRDASGEYDDYSADFTDDFEAEESGNTGGTGSMSPKFDRDQLTQTAATGTSSGTGSSRGGGGGIDSLLPPRQNNNARAAGSGGGARSKSPRSPASVNRESNSRGGGLLSADEAAARRGGTMVSQSYNKLQNTGQQQQQQAIPFTHQSMQAEIVLDEISKEVMQMRNMQRDQLRERHAMAKERKARADERRAVYETKLREAEEIKVNAENEKTKHAEQIASLEKQISSITMSKEVVISSMHAIEEDTDRLRSSLASVNKELHKTHEENSTLEAAYFAAKEKWALRETGLVTEVKKATLLQEAVQRSIEASEARFQKEREKLPEYQKQALAEQRERLVVFEAQLHEQEGALRALEARKLADIDALRNEARQELAKQRDRADISITSEKKEAEEMLSAARSERHQWELIKTEEMANLEKAKFELRQREQSLLDQRKELDANQAEFEGARRMLQPTLDAAARERDEATALKHQADRVLLAAEEHSSTILAAERGLIRREQEIAKQEHALAQERNTHAHNRKVLAAESAKVKYKRQSIETERFQLHQASLDLASQVALVNRESVVLSRIQCNQQDQQPEGGSGGTVTMHQKKFRSEENVDTNSDTENQNNYSNSSSSSSGSGDGDSGGKRRPLLMQDPYPSTSIAMQGVTSALDSIMHATAAPVDEDASTDQYRYLERESMNVDLQPPAAPPLQSALELLDSKLANIGFKGGNSTLAKTDYEVGNSHLGELRSSLDSVSSTSANMAAMASRYGVFATNNM